MSVRQQSQDRYSRQVLFAPIGQKGQTMLAESKVLIVGMGALGTVLANHMVRAGVGYVRFVDRDFVEMSNLQRQMLFDERDVAESTPKAIAAKRKLEQVNSEVSIDAHIGDVTSSNIQEYADQMDLILDGTDNFQTRFLMNDYAFQEGIPYVYGGAVSSRGMQATFIPGQTPCLRCFIDDNGGGAQDTCDTSGVLASVVDIVASYQATEAIKLLVGATDLVRKSLLSFDLWSGQQHHIKWNKPKENCPTCQAKQFPALHSAHDQVTSLCGRDTIQIKAKTKQKWDLAEWSNRLKKVGTVEETPFLLRFYVEDVHMILFPDGRVMIQGTDDMIKAKSLYAKYIGM